MTRLTILTLLILLASLFANDRIVSAGGVSNIEYLRAFEVRFKTAGEKGVPRLIELGMNCFNSGLPKHANMCFETAIARDSDNKEAHKYLGHVLVDKKWMSLQERDSALIAANPGKVMFGSTFVTAETARELLMAERTKVGWNFDHFFNSSDSFTMYAAGDAAFAWSASRLIEATLALFDLEFGDALKRPKEKLVIHVFTDQKVMDAQITKVTGKAVSAPCIFDAGSMASYVACGPETGNLGRDYIVEAAVRGILGLHGHNGDYPGHWVHTAMLYYFRLSLLSDETLGIGYYHAYNPDLFTIAQKQASQGLTLPMETLTSLGPEAFKTDPNNELKAQSWMLFYILNHEFQGLYKKEFHDYLKGAVKGKTDYKNLKKVKSLGVVEKTYREFVARMIPLEER